MKKLSRIWVIPGLCLLMSCHNGPINKEQGLQAPAADTGWALLPFLKLDSVNPVLGPGKDVFFCPIRKQKVLWEEKDVFNPAIVVRDKKVWMLYRAQDKTGKPDGTSRIGIAESIDGTHFSRHPEPVLFPDEDPWKKYEWQGGCEDPRIVEDADGVYYMTYTAYDGRLARLMIARSRDLLHWEKKGPVFAKAFNGKYIDKWSKSGAIVSRYEEGRIIATRIGGKYWMYWGDQFIWAAVSDDLINWQPVEMAAGEKPAVPLKGQALEMPDLKIVVATRIKKFDSDLVESGPPAMLTDKGILLIYNSKNLRSTGDSSLAEGSYAAGQVLLDKNDPVHLIDRLPAYFMKPDKPYEITGQVNQVCFLEGLAWYQQRWLLYYGTADSRIAVAAKK
jgi:beta-1,2-mannosidase